MRMIDANPGKIGFWTESMSTSLMYGTSDLFFPNERTNDF